MQINHLAAGRVPQGATVERAVPTPLHQGECVQLDLNAADFATAREVARAINRAKGAGTAQALDGRVVRVRMPVDPNGRVAFLADIENLTLALGKPAAKVVLNARTGSVVMNEAVTLGACAVAHGSLSVTISSTPVVSQPAPVRRAATPWSPRRPTSRSSSSRAPSCRCPPAPSWPTSSRRSTRSAPRRRTCWRSCRR